MGALGIKRNRSIDSLWEVNAKTIMALEATLGVAIGSDDGRVIYIQDTGVKEVGRGYIDRATKKVHICKERTEDVINTSTKFADHSIQSIYNKLENLININNKNRTDILFDYIRAPLGETITIPPGIYVYSTTNWMGGSNTKYGVIDCTGYTGASNGIAVYDILGGVCFEVIHPNKIKALEIPSAHAYTLTKIAAAIY